MTDAHMPEFGPMFQAMADYEWDYRRAGTYPAAARQAPHLRERAVHRASAHSTERRPLRGRLRGRLALLTRGLAPQVP